MMVFGLSSLGSAGQVGPFVSLEPSFTELEDPFPMWYVLPDEGVAYHIREFTPDASVYAAVRLGGE